MNIDHLVVAASGVWVIDAKNYDGRVERRDLGGWRRIDDRLYVNGRDRTSLTAGLHVQAAVVAKVLEAGAVDDVPVRTVSCFTNSDWKLFAKPFTINGVLVTWATNLIETVRLPGPLAHQQIEHISQVLAAGLPPARH